MGLTPLEGAVMGTRCGDIDPAIPTFIQQQEGLSAAEVDSILNKKSGIYGITGKYTDRRDVGDGIKEGDQKCQLAFDIEAYRIKKYIGAYFAAVGKPDMIVFTAGVGEMSCETRQAALEGLEGLGIIVDTAVNMKTRTRSSEVLITTPESDIPVYVIPTDEELVFIEDVVGILEGTYTDHLNYKYTFAESSFVRK
jgi:acetate kinase